MKFLTTPKSFESEFQRLSHKYNSFDWAVAWATDGHAGCEGLKHHRHKIRRIIVGTHFHQTAPSFIREFADVPTVRYRLDQAGLNGVFHPKLYLFSNDEADWEAIIGSANFTTAAFTRNVEHAVLIGSADQCDGVTYAELVGEITQLWDNGRHFTPAELDAYGLRWAKSKKLLTHVAGHDGGGARQESIYNRELLSLSWDGYLQALRDKQERYFPDRLTVLRETKKLWAAQPSFARLSPDDRKKISGTASEKVIRWRLFGSMRGAFKFTRALHDENPHLLAALDEIPLTGEIRAEHYEAYIARLSRAFTQAKEFGGVAVATRLLCLRRPDYFVCVDKKNRAGLFETLGVTAGDVNVATYWDTVVARLTDTPWWASRQPDGDADAQTVWDGRVAMVDALFYEGHG